MLVHNSGSSWLTLRFLSAHFDIVMVLSCCGHTSCPIIGCFKGKDDMATRGICTRMGACRVAPTVLIETVERPWVVFRDMATAWAWAALVIHLLRSGEWRLANERVVPIGCPTVDGSMAAPRCDVGSDEPVESTVR